MSCESEDEEKLSGVVSKPDVLSAVRRGVYTLQPLIYFNSSSFISTASGNRVSRQSILNRSDNITVSGDSILNEGAFLRGDTASIRLGRYVWVGKNTVLQPCCCCSNSSSSSSSKPHSRCCSTAACCA